VANTLALRKGGIDLSQIAFSVPGGEIEVNASGPTGFTYFALGLTLLQVS
jgi:hypothetical protein